MAVASFELLAAGAVIASLPAAVQDEDTLYASVLLHSYALVETAVADRLGADARDFGGIEDWGARLAASVGQGRRRAR